jgi:hypothetical protein
MTDNVLVNFVDKAAAKAAKKAAKKREPLALPEGMPVIQVRNGELVGLTWLRSWPRSRAGATRYARR